MKEDARNTWNCIAAIPLGASFLEKHFTLNKNQPGTDHTLSADGEEMKALVQAVREVESSLGGANLSLLSTEAEGRKLFRRGLVTTREITAGTVIMADMVAARRPAAGIQPKDLPFVLGRRALVNLASGAPITWESI